MEVLRKRKRFMLGGIDPCERIVIVSEHHVTDGRCAPHEGRHDVPLLAPYRRAPLPHVKWLSEFNIDPRFFSYFPLQPIGEMLTRLQAPSRDVVTTDLRTLGIGPRFTQHENFPIAFDERLESNEERGDHAVMITSRVNYHQLTQVAYTSFS